MFCVCACPQCLDAKRNRDLHAHCSSTPECLLADRAENNGDYNHDAHAARLRRRQRDLAPA